MVCQILSHGQDLDGLEFQYSGQNWLGYNGGAGFHYPFIHHVQSAEAGGD